MCLILFHIIFIGVWARKTVDRNIIRPEGRNATPAMRRDGRGRTAVLVLLSCEADTGIPAEMKLRLNVWQDSKFQSWVSSW